MVKHYHYPGFHEPGTAEGLGINLKVWDGLTKNQQEMIAFACQAENSVTLAEFNAKNGAALEVLVNQHGVRLHKFSREILQQIGVISGEVMAEAGATDAITKKVYDSFIKSRKASISWSKLGDQSYWNARLLPFKYG